MNRIRITSALFFLFYLGAFSAFAEGLPYKGGEVINFDIRYKYGVIMMKGGSAEYKIDDATYNSRTAHKTSMNFKTNGFFDKIFKVRDTLITYTNLKSTPIYFERSIHEGSTKFTEETIFNSFSPNYTEVRTIRKNEEGITRFDTLLVADMEGFDFLSIFTHMRTWDFSSMPLESIFHIAIFTGKKKTNIIIRFKGQTLLERSETLKYRAYKIELDITDVAFSESKNAVEAWISDDDNHIPLKIKAKLKMGAMEVDMTKYKGLKYPLSSEVRISTRK